MSRAVSPVIGVLLLTVVSLVLAGVAGVVVSGMAPGPAPSEPVALSATANATSGQIVLVHESGPDIDVREIEVRIAVDGTRLEHQPPVPFSGAEGFFGAPTGPFNAQTDPRWKLGEPASLKIADNNPPGISTGATVRIEIYRDDLPIASVETTAR